jgi:Acyl-CoA reductase (LuxC)
MPLAVDSAALWNPGAGVATAADLAATLERLGRAAPRLRDRRIDDILASLDALAQLWLAPESRWRRCAEEVLPAASGFSPQMVRRGLPWMIEPLRGEHLAALLDAELGSRRALGAAAGGHAAGPPVIVHILSGTLPALAAAQISLSLAVKSTALVKAARGDRCFPFLYCASLAEVDRELAECAAAAYWPGGDSECELTVFSAADLVVAFGADASLAAARARCRSRFIGHGHKISFAAVTREVAADPQAAGRAAIALALDVAMWDQRGCLSPQLCFVEGDADAARDFARRVCLQLDRLAVELPPGEAAPSDLVAVRRFRDEASWRGNSSAPVALFTAAGLTAGTVVAEPAAKFLPTPLCRSLRVQPLADLAELTTVLRAHRPVLEAAGLAVLPERRPAIEAMLTAAGLHHVCALGEMQRPSLFWRQGGRPRVAEWIEWE